MAENVNTRGAAGNTLLRRLPAGSAIRTVSGTSWGEVMSYSSDSPLAFAGGYSAEDVADAVSYGGAAPRWRLTLLNSDDSVRREIPEEDIALGGSYSENYQNGQRRSLSFSLYNEDGRYTPGVNGTWITDRIGLEMGLRMADGGTAWFKRGVYAVSQPSVAHSNDQDLVQVSAGDKWSLLSGASGTLGDTYEVPSGSLCADVIAGILLSDRGDGGPIDVRPPFIHPSLRNKRTQATITMSAGQTYADILLEIATQLSAEVFYNSEGTLTVLPIEEASLDNGKASQWDFDEDQVKAISFSFSAQEIYNRVIVVGSTSGGQYHRAEASNEDPSSPTSVSRIGVRTAPIINDANITTDRLAQERAQYELRKVLLLRTPIAFEARINPLITVNCVITISSPFLLMGKERFVVQSVSHSLDHSGSMTVSAASTSNLPFLVDSSEGRKVAAMAEGQGSGGGDDIIKVNEWVYVSDRAVVGAPYRNDDE